MRLYMSLAIVVLKMNLLMVIFMKLTILSWFPSILFLSTMTRFLYHTVALEFLSTKFCINLENMLTEK